MTDAGGGARCSRLTRTGRRPLRQEAQMEVKMVDLHSIAVLLS